MRRRLFNLAAATEIVIWLRKELLLMPILLVGCAQKYPPAIIVEGHPPRVYERTEGRTATMGADRQPAHEVEPPTDARSAGIDMTIDCGSPGSFDLDIVNRNPATLLVTTGPTVSQSSVGGEGQSRKPGQEFWGVIEIVQGHNIDALEFKRKVLFELTARYTAPVVTLRSGEHLTFHIENVIAQMADTDLGWLNDTNVLNEWWRGSPEGPQNCGVDVDFTKPFTARFEVIANVGERENGWMRVRSSWCEIDPKPPR